jgi:hypothetical protein
MPTHKNTHHISITPINVHISVCLCPGVLLLPIFICMTICEQQTVLRRKCWLAFRTEAACAVACNRRRRCAERAAGPSNPPAALSLSLAKCNLQAGCRDRTTTGCCIIIAGQLCREPPSVQASSDINNCTRPPNVAAMSLISTRCNFDE